MKPRRIVINDEEIPIGSIRDGKGRLYEITEEYYRRAYQRPEASKKHQTRRFLAKEMLDNGLKRLTNIQRSVILYLMDEKSVKYIAEELDISQSAVKKHARAARKKLGNLIESTRKTMEEL